MVCWFSWLSAIYLHSAISSLSPETHSEFFPVLPHLFFRVLWQHLCRMYNVIHRKSEAVKTSSVLSLSIKDLFNSYFAFSLWQMMIRNDIFNTIFIIKAYGLQSDTRENQFIFDGSVPPQGHKWLWGSKERGQSYFLTYIQFFFFVRYKCHSFQIFALHNLYVTHI